ncbi:unnamed protein product [Strongylus vulgaris]|uniref:Uncharacterized protein n=1 Tax=Strongylus vulgaris TaxID=40348 RepID=A0A3P7KRM7_STRVU|nr:unnamed protein product [Strongylus vulgaris]
MAGNDTEMESNHRVAVNDITLLGGNDTVSSAGNDTLSEVSKKDIRRA